MVSDGDTAPDFTAPLANGDVGSFTLTDHLHEAPLVLAFFPAAFTGTCTHEMETFQDRLGEFEDTGASVLGISIDTPFTQNAFRDELNLSFDMISDSNRDIIDEWNLGMDFTDLGVRNVAKRAVFVVDQVGDVVYRWVSDDPGVEPNYDDVLEAVKRSA